MDIKGIFTNPWVLGIGGAIGLLLLLNSRGGSSTVSEQSAYTGTVANYSGLEYAARSAEIAATVNTAQIEGRVQERMKLLDVFQQMFAVQADATTKQNEVNAGVIQSRIAADTALRLDQGQNFARYREAWLSTDAALTVNQRASDLAQTQAKNSFDLSKFVVGAQLQEAKISTDASVKLGVLQTKSAERIAKKVSGDSVKAGKVAADSAFWNNIWNGVFGVAQAVIPKLPVVGA